MIGVNGSGKSNLISFFHMLNMMMTGNLQLFIGRSGGASSLLYYGAKRTLQIEAKLEFETSEVSDSYEIRLVHGAPDSLVFTEEQITYRDKTGAAAPYVKSFGSGHKESALTPELAQNNTTARFIRSLLARCRMFQFHDTSQEAHMRQRCRVDDNRLLKHNAGNLASILLRLQSENPDCYQQIIRRIRRVIPVFSDFDLAPDANNSQYVMLNWRERESEYSFGPHQLSDGSLRFIALATLLSLPPGLLPAVIVIDEPELGLHPAAIEVLSEMIRDAATKAQLLLATQSLRLVDYCKIGDLIICDRQLGSSEISRRSPMDVDGWSDEYTLGQVWESRKLGAWPK